MSLDFGWTCPTIDKNIEDLNGILADKLYDMIIKLIPLVDKNEANQIAYEYADKIYEDAKYIYENVRETNTKLRKFAEDQIDDLNKQILEYEDQIDDLNKQIKDLENEIKNLEYQEK